MNLVGELVLARNQILQFTNTTEDPALVAPSQRLNLITTAAGRGDEDADAADRQHLEQISADGARRGDHGERFFRAIS